MHNLTKIRIFRILLWISYPFAILLCSLPAYLKKKNSSGLFFFFDRYSIGGAQRIHLDILASVADIHKQVYFTRKSPNDRLKSTFYSIPGTDNQDIHTWCDNLLFRLFSVHYFAFYLNRHQNAHLLSANSTFFYDLLPFLSKRVVATELLHNFSYGKKGMEFFGLANHQRLNFRVVYDSFTLINIKNQYAEYRVDPKYLDRIKFIEPGVDLPVEIPVKDIRLPIKILYAGRGGSQKRVWILNKIVEITIKLKWPVQFQFAGTMTDELSELTKKNSIIHGEVSSKEQMNEIYNDNHLIILTSAYEGFPMVIKEGMARGCIPFVTALEGNKMHLLHEENSLLIDAVEDESAVIEKATEILQSLIANPSTLVQLSNNAAMYAQNHFRKEEFMKKYRSFLLERK